MNNQRELIMRKLEDDIRRDRIKVLLLYYKVPRSLEKSFWRAYNAAHREQQPQTSIPGRW